MVRVDLVLVVMMASLAKGMADLIITGLVAYPESTGSSLSKFNVIQLAACTSIPDLTQFAIAEYSTSSIQAYQVVSFNDGGQSPISIPQGATIYTSQLSKSSFTSFFGFEPSIYFQSSFSFIGTNNQALIYRGTTVVDVYEVLGVGGTNTKADFGSGWAMRKPALSASATFDLSEWVVQPGAYNNFPTTDAQANVPIAWGNYTCRSNSAPSGAPKPVQPERTGGRDPEPDHNRPPVAPTTAATPSPEPTSSPTPEPPLTPKPHQPPRRPSIGQPRGPTAPPTCACPPTSRRLRKDEFERDVTMTEERRRFLACCSGRQLKRKDGDRHLYTCCGAT